MSTAQDRRAGPACVREGTAVIADRGTDARTASPG